MEVIAGPIVDFDKEVDLIAKRVFMRAVEIAGGFRKLILYRNLTWVPSLVEASYVIVLHEEFDYPPEKIAEFLGVTKETVKRILNADEEKVREYLEGLVEKVDEHKAGGLAKLAYKKLKEEGALRAIEVTESLIASSQRDLPEFAWPLLVLHHIRGLDFPVSKERLKQAFEGVDLKINGKPIQTLLNYLEYPIKSPADLLKKLKEAAF
ncbi:MAG: KaiC associated regulatory domain-containing protein [Candidatus Micrarchaeota archaeon]|nr:KaiC associated regulatory domain-containing protein [Candidatus Micrarchaeota archaeon]